MNQLDWLTLESPGQSYRPMVRWWWPGLDVQEDVLLSQLEDLQSGGFAGAEIQAFLRGASHFDPDNRTQAMRVHRYGTDAYFAIVRRLMKKARQLDLLLELTAGSGYPLGDAQIDPQRDGMHALIVGSISVEGGESREIPMISAKTAFNTIIGSERSSSYMTGKMVVWSMDWPRMRRDLRLLRVTIARGINKNGTMSRMPSSTTMLDKHSVKDVTGYVIDGVLHYSFPPGHWYVFPAFEGPSYQRVKTDSRMNPDQESYVIDHFASGRIEQYLDRHIGRGDFQDFITEPFRAFFIDSFELVGPYYWTEAFLTEFRNRRGYDLVPYLPVLMTRENTVNEKGAAIACFDLPEGFGERIRRDYDRTLADLFINYFMMQVRDWAHNRGFKSRVQCYGHMMDPLLACGVSDIPETEQLASSGLLDFIKMPASAALLYDKPLTTAEAFVWPGCDYMETPLRFLTASDKLTAAGIGQLYYHGMPYLHSEYSWPGYYAWHNSFGSFVNRNSPLWPYISSINRTISRNQYLTQQGKRNVDICLYTGTLRYEFPYMGPEFREDLSDGELNGIDRQEQFNHIRFDSRCDRWQFMAAKERGVALHLTEAGYDYCHINCERLERAELYSGKLTIGEATFRALLIPPISFIEPKASVCINQLIKSGFPVFCIEQKPGESFGFLNADEQDALVRRVFNEIEPIKAEDISKVLLQTGIDPTVDYCGERGFEAVHRSFKNHEVYFVRSHQNGLRKVRLCFAQPQGNAVLYDTRSGKAFIVEGKLENGWTFLTLPFTHYGSFWVVFGDTSGADIDEAWYRALQASVQGECIQALCDGWALSIRSIVEGDEKTTKRTDYSLADWADDTELGTYTGWGVYEKSFDLQLHPQQDWVLDLGIVGDIAKIFINGQLAGQCITLPYAICTGDLLRKGRNTLRIEVLNSLRNGLLGAGRLQIHHEKSMAGLIGPVRLLK